MPRKAARLSRKNVRRFSSGADLAQAPPFFLKQEWAHAHCAQEAKR
jgi:hypothetical protein